MRLSFFLFLLLVVSCAPKKQKAKAPDGKSLFKLNCSICHGIDGSLKANGSKDLKLSNLTKAERIVMVRKGKGAMTAFEGVLTPAEIDAVVSHTMEFKAD